MVGLPLRLWEDVAAQARLEQVDTKRWQRNHVQPDYRSMPMGMLVRHAQKHMGRYQVRAHGGRALWPLRGSDLISRT